MSEPSPPARGFPELPPTSAKCVTARCHEPGAPPATAGDHQVVVVDDNLNMLTALERLLTTHGYRVRLHQDPAEFLTTGPPAGPACLLLDNQLEASMTGVQVHAEMVRRGWNLPTIFLSAHWNVQSVVTAIRAGADGYLTKPYEATELLKAIGEALQRAQATHEQNKKKAASLALAATLTKRERQIACLVLAGKMNKAIADELGLALVTVKVYRARARSKLGVTNTAELASFARVVGWCS